MKVNCIKYLAILLFACSCQSKNTPSQCVGTFSRSEKSIRWFEDTCRGNGQQARCISVSEGYKTTLECFCEDLDDKSGY